MSKYTEPLTQNSLPTKTTLINNFWYNYNEDSRIAIVFIHGIFSDSRGCWLSENNIPTSRVFWPDLIRTDARFNNPSIFLAGYTTKVDAGPLLIADCANEVLKALRTSNTEGKKLVLEWDKILFICHSTGGIVARYLLNAERETFREKCIGLALIASPSLGSIWANIGRLAAEYYGNRLAKQLQVDETSLDTLHREFRDLVNLRAKRLPWLFGAEACETEMVFRDKLPKLIRWILPNKLRVVSTLSAGQYFGAVDKLSNTNHFTTVKPDDINHPSHRFLVRLMDDYEEIMDEYDIQKPRLSDSQISLLKKIKETNGAYIFHLYDIMNGRDIKRDAIVYRCKELERNGYIVVKPNQTDLYYEITKKGVERTQ